MSWKGESTRAVLQDLLGVPIRAVMLAATGQHTGKTTLSLGVFRGLVRRWGQGKVAYMKPLGQRYVDVTLPNGMVHKVDRDVEVVRRTFGLKDPWECMSPVVFPPGYTRDCIDGKVSSEMLLSRIKDGFTHLATRADFTLLEGSGHMGVGSIANLNNAQVAGALGLEVVIIAPGGLGISFDQLALNKALLEKHGARLRGVILNKVEPAKYDMVKDYYSRQLKNLWDAPLLGCVPYQENISKPSMAGYSQILGGKFVAYEQEEFRTFDSTRLVLSSGEADPTLYDAVKGQLVVTSSTRTDVIEKMIENQTEILHTSNRTMDLRGGLILVGDQPPPKGILDDLDKAGIPTVFVKKRADFTAFEVLEAMAAFTQKHDYDDHERLNATMDLIEQNIDFETLCSAPPFGGQMAIRLGQLVRW